ncbi:M1 family metallopeptidase [Aquimarina sp. W85]|uniref:M1 family metallopeptidase n=1 Tax=Aquimarina rhodophyticola TaxID=3342246 RepID=UPI0036709CDB
MIRFLFILFVSVCFYKGLAQKTFTRQDTLRGSITPERSWWDLTYYNLDIEVVPKRKYITGSTTIHYKVLKSKKTLQVDLQPPLRIDSVIQNGVVLSVRSEKNAHFVSLQKKQSVDSIESVQVFYSGYPREAVNAPWDGGISWKTDSNGKPFIASSCQGLGASIWWPNKDHMYDEVDSMAINVTVPKDLMNVSNGRLRKVTSNTTTKTYHWFVSNPINNYGVNINIGDYIQFGETYQGEKGPLTMNYYVLRDHLEKAKKQFTDAPKMMKAFEYWFGPYPFYEDSFKLVEVPYLGMEHQSSVTYGNQYKNGYLGKDLSETGWGLKFDFIIIHESGHEWFANNITHKDAADMWIHESFTAYSESLFLDFYYGKEAASAYVIGTRKRIQNDSPIIGTYHVNQEGSSDMYFKGSNMLHTLRQLVDNDDKWRKILRGLNKEFYHQTVTTQQIESFLSNHTAIDLSAFFNQYLRDTRIPIVECEMIDKDTLRYRYTNIVKDFDMPIRIITGDNVEWIHPQANWQTVDNIDKNWTVDKNFYINLKKI